MIKYLLALLVSTTVFAALGDTEKALFVNKNLLDNPGFENGKAKWSVSTGSFSITNTTANVAFGGAAATWDASASTQTFTSTAVTIPPGLYGRNGTVSCLIQTPSGTATHTLSAYDGSSSLVSQTVVSSTSYTKTEANFIFPSSGSISVRLTANANEPSINVDDCIVSAASNISNVSQAQFVGSAYIPTVTNCTWSRTSTSFGAFTADTDCGGPTVEFNPGPGTIQTTDTDLPKFTVNDLPPGIYEVTIETSQGATENINASLAISDGSTTSGTTSYNTNAGSEVGHFVKGYFTYTTSGNRSFELYGRSASGTLNVQHSQQSGVAKMNFSIKRFPSSSEVAYNPSQTPGYWAGYHDSTCSWGRANSSFGDPTADATCVFTERKNVNFGSVTSYLSGSDKLPGIVFTPKVVGSYLVCVGAYASNTTASAATFLQLYDGSASISEINGNSNSVGTWLSFCGIASFTSIAPKTISLQTRNNGGGTVTVASPGGTANAVEWSITQISPQVSNPQIVNNISGNTGGSLKLARAKISNSGSCAVVSQDGSWIDSVSHPGTGQCTITMTTGFWSVAPYCHLTPYTDGRFCSLRSAETTTSVDTRCVSPSGGGTNVDEPFNITCIGVP
jgi:hypothetical protein